MINEIIEKAKEARNASYSPYSNFKVGCAILMKNGDYVLGCNVENSSYGLSICAERNAMFQMVSKGYKKDDAVAICIIGQTDTPISPCGACRQVMEELLPKNCRVILTNLKNDVKEMTIEELLPYSFSEDSLK
jgi:cytidine deaminase